MNEPTVFDIVNSLVLGLRELMIFVWGLVVFFAALIVIEQKVEKDKGDEE
jgi:hypothetical protein